MNPLPSQPSGGGGGTTTVVIGGSGVSFHTHPATAITGDTNPLLPDRLADETVEILDFNAVLETGFWAADTSASNAPASSFWTLRVIRYGIDTTTGNFAHQIAQEVVPPYRTFVRDVNVITWTAWEQIDRTYLDTRYRLVSDIDFQQDTQSGDVTPNGTANSSLTGLSITVTSPGTSAVYAVEIDADVSFTGAQTNLIELLVDGVAETPQLISGASASGQRIDGHKKWRVTGLAAGSRTFTAQTRNTGVGTAATVRATHTLMTVERKS
jgi:hypothetical protein